MLHDENENETREKSSQQNPGAGCDGQAHLHSHLGESLVDLERLGRLWATHGIRMGVAALQTSAVTLSQVASTLTTLAEGLKTHESRVDEEKQR